MSRTKAVRILGRGVWVLDNSHDIVVARMVEEAERLDVVDAETLQNWRVWASIADLAFHQEAPSPSAVVDRTQARTTCGDGARGTRLVAEQPIPSQRLMCWVKRGPGDPTRE